MKKKLSLNTIQVKSFITAIEGNKINKGGVSIAPCQNNIDTTVVNNTNLCTVPFTYGLGCSGATSAVNVGVTHTEFPCRLIDSDSACYSLMTCPN